MDTPGSKFICSVKAVSAKTSRKVVNNIKLTLFFNVKKITKTFCEYIKYNEFHWPKCNV